MQTLHNARLFCPGGSLERNDRICEDCKGRKIAWPSVSTRLLPAIAHRDWRGRSHAGGSLAAQDVGENGLVYVASTPFYRRKFIEAGFPEEKIVVKPHFVEDPGITHSDGGYVLFVGRLSTEKGVQSLLRAWEKLNHIPLKIRGEGPLLPEAQDSPENAEDRLRLCRGSIEKG